MTLSVLTVIVVVAVLYMQAGVLPHHWQEVILPQPPYSLPSSSPITMTVFTSRLCLAHWRLPLAFPFHAFHCSNGVCTIASTGSLSLPVTHSDIAADVMLFWVVWFFAAYVVYVYTSVSSYGVNARSKPCVPLHWTTTLIRAVHGAISSKFSKLPELTQPIGQLTVNDVQPTRDSIAAIYKVLGVPDDAASAVEADVYHVRNVVDWLGWGLLPSARVCAGFHCRCCRSQP